MDLPEELTRLAALSRAVDDTDPVVAEFSEQFGVDVSQITDDQRVRLREALGDSMFGAVLQMYLADFLPRVRAGLAALGVPVRWPDAGAADAAAVATAAGGAAVADALFNGFAPAVARLRALDPVTTELVRLRGAAAHNCRLCKSLREGHALDAGGSETLYEAIEHFETSALISEAQQAALRYVDALIWSPGAIDADVAAGARRYFTEEQAVELTLDVMRNAMNKIMVALGADAARVQHGTERYLVNADGQTVFG